VKRLLGKQLGKCLHDESPVGTPSALMRALALL
jgi:hypothetical protein